MGKKRKKEEELLTRIKNFKKQSRAALRELFLKEREEGHRRGDVFFRGVWIPRDKLAVVQESLRKRHFTVFFEVLFLLFMVIVVDLVIWVFFMKLLLPYVI